MEKISCSLTVLFDDPFWVGIFRRCEQNETAVCKVTFGAEPKDAEVLALVLKRYDGLSFSPKVSERQRASVKNPKRRLRMVRKELHSLRGIGTKSQQALKKQQEQKKAENKAVRRAVRTEKAEQIFNLKQRKRKEKHKGH